VFPRAQRVEALDVAIPQPDATELGLHDMEVAERAADHPPGHVVRPLRQPHVDPCRAALVDDAGKRDVDLGEA